MEKGMYIQYVKNNYRVTKDLTSATSANYKQTLDLTTSMCTVSICMCVRVISYVHRFWSLRTLFKSNITFSCHMHTHIQVFTTECSFLFLCDVQLECEGIRKKDREMGNSPAVHATTQTQEFLWETGHLAGQLMHGKRRDVCVTGLTCEPWQIELI